MLTVNEQNEILKSDDIKSVLGSEQGRRFMWRLLSYCGVYRDVEGEPEYIMKQLGKRQVGLYLLGILSAENDEQVFTMMREAKNKEKEDEYRRDIEDRRSREDSGAEDRDRSHTYTGNAIEDYI